MSIAARFSALRAPALDTADEVRRRGVLAAAGAYVIWGFVPLYFRPLDGVGPVEVIAHRVLWCVLLLAAYRMWSGGLRTLRPALRPRIVGALALSSGFIAVNWLLFVLAVHEGQVLQTSLGYYINPLLNVALGMVLLRERLRPLQALAISLAAAAVIVLLLRFGQFPWIALTLAFTFALYGFIRKHVPVNAIDGLLIETALLAPAALVYLAWLTARGECAFAAGGWGLRGYLALAGPVTTVPLLLFATGARRLPLSTLGFLQYLAPSLSFLLAVTVFDEPFGRAQAVTFGLIWCALAVFSADMLRRPRAV